MNTTMDPTRLRSQLRQAKRTADSGKRAVALQLYGELVEAAPESGEAWLGLAKLMNAGEEQTAAFLKAMELAPETKTYEEAKALLPGEPWPPHEEAVATETAVEPNAPAFIPLDEDEELFCYRHPQTETGLRCYNCNRGICSKCVIKTPVGYICPECKRDLEDGFFNATTIDYLIAPAVAFPLSLIAGWLVVNFLAGGGFFFIIITFLAGGAVGSFIGRVTKRSIGNRRGRYLPQLVGGLVVAGVAVFALPLLLAIVLTGQAGALFSLIVPGVYIFTATGAAVYQMK